MDQPLTPFGDAVAGALGAATAAIITYPLDMSKTRIQAGLLEKEVTVRGQDGKPRKVKISPNIFKGVLEVVKRDGIPALYSGVVASTMNTLSLQFSYFFFYSSIRTFWLERLTKKTPPGVRVVIGTASELIIGALAAAVAQVFTIPVSVIATRQQLRPRKTREVEKAAQASAAVGAPGQAPVKRGGVKEEEDDEDYSFLGVGKKIIKQDGPTGLWRGLKPSLLLVVNPSLTYGVFERIKSLILTATPDGKMTPWQSFFVGALSKSLATIVTFPYILAKLILQSERPPEKGAIGLLARIAREKGIKGWYQGMEAQLIKAVITQAFLFTARDYFTDTAKLMMNKRKA
ncbi:mitochondrial carrier [Jaminaea rosea]|uniref:Mitochondrial carrier n=1 Tax=Jaminaea rosea TaxID=1569628 RepID=A0A316UMG4_9BASI|nr:mitochondrial carrier [Jaminaea rosea]PWN24365.1 mitochondrial carrier [Jaminaea rosea]